MNMPIDWDTPTNNTSRPRIVARQRGKARLELKEPETGAWITTDTPVRPER